MARNFSGAKPWTVVAITATGLWAATALAYVQPADSILASVASRRAVINFSTIVLEGTYRRGNEPPHTIWEAIQAGGARRIEHKTETGVEVVLQKKNQRWTFPMGTASARPERVDDNLLLTFVTRVDKDPGGQRGVAFCTKFGIDIDTVHLARFESEPVFVIGAKPWEPNKPQLWINKRLRVPVRWVRVDKKSGVVSETRLIGFGSELTHEWYPRRIERWENGVLIDATTYTEIRLNEKLDKKLFRPPS